MSGPVGAAPQRQDAAESVFGIDQTMIADYTESVVPASSRRSNFRMFLTFGSMQLVFGAVLVGYTARFQGFSLGSLILGMAIAAATMTVYCIGSANLGAVIGQTHAVTTRGVFGTVGSAIVSLLLVIDGMGFYLFTVLFMISLGQALIGTLPAVSLITALLAFVMIVNNYFGFTGLQRFAQFVAVPVVAVWGLYATIKAFASSSGHALAAVPHATTPTSFFVVVGAMVGLSTWGNEPDIFRYAKPGRSSWWNVPTIAIPYVLGAFLFPIMGYMIAALSNESAFSASIKYFASFTLFGLGGLMMVVLLVNQWAVQDGNIYVAVRDRGRRFHRRPGSWDVGIRPYLRWFSRAPGVGDGSGRICGGGRGGGPPPERQGHAWLPGYNRDIDARCRRGDGRRRRPGGRLSG